MLIYLALGVVLVLAVHLLLSGASRSTPQAVRHSSRWFFYLLLLLLALYLLRLGLVHYAAIIGFIGAALALAQRVQTVHGIWHRLRRNQSSAAAAKPTKMHVEEARAILGVSAEAGAQEIQEAYRRLIRQNHPDQGGTEYLASQINLARDTLLDITKQP